MSAPSMVRNPIKGALTPTPGVGGVGAGEDHGALLTDAGCQSVSNFPRRFNQLSKSGSDDSTTRWKIG